MAIFEIKEGTLTHNCEKGQPSVIDLVSRNYVLDYLAGQQLKKTESSIVDTARDIVRRSQPYRKF